MLGINPNLKDSNPPGLSSSALAKLVSFHNFLTSLMQLPLYNFPHATSLSKLPHATSFIQLPSCNFPHTTFLKQLPSHNFPHATSLTQLPLCNFPHATSLPYATFLPHTTFLMQLPPSAFFMQLHPISLIQLPSCNCPYATSFMQLPSYSLFREGISACAAVHMC